MTRCSSRSVALLTLAAIAASSLPVAAQPVDDAQSTAAAQALFEQAARAMEAGDLVAACPKLAEVVRLEPRGAGARVKLADCYERQGRFASAWATYLGAESAARTAGQRARAREAHDAADRLRAELSTLTVQVPPGAAGAFVVLRDGASLGPPQWNEPVPVDGGEHVIELHKAGESAPRHRVIVVVAAKNARETLVIPDDALRDPVAPPVAPPVARPVVRPVSAPIASASPPPQRPPSPSDGADPGLGIPTWALVVGVAGLALGGTAIAFRAHAGAVESDQVEACGAALDACPPSFDVASTNDEKHTSFGMFVGMGVASIAAVSVAVIGAAFGLERRASADPAPVVAFGPGALLVGGSAGW